MKILTIDFTGTTGGCRYLVKLHKRKFRFKKSGFLISFEKEREKIA